MDCRCMVHPPRLEHMAVQAVLDVQSHLIEPQQPQIVGSAPFKIPPDLLLKLSVQSRHFIWKRLQCLSPIKMDRSDQLRGRRNSLTCTEPTRCGPTLRSSLRRPPEGAGPQTCYGMAAGSFHMYCGVVVAIRCLGCPDRKMAQRSHSTQSANAGQLSQKRSILHSALLLIDRVSNGERSMLSPEAYDEGPEPRRARGVERQPPARRFHALSFAATAARARCRR